MLTKASRTSLTSSIGAVRRFASFASGQPERGTDLTADVLVIGSGPVGSTFARKLVDAGKKVIMIDAGPKHTEVPGEHIKNSFYFQRNVDAFASVIRGHLQPISVPVDNSTPLTLDPSTWDWDRTHNRSFVRHSMNPAQDPARNLSGAAACYAVGGMGSHWTCACPRQHPSERSKILSDAQWDKYYTEAEKLLKVNRNVFQNSIRNTLVREALQREYKELQGAAAPGNLPLAAQRSTENEELVFWSGADAVLGPLVDEAKYESTFKILPEHRCFKLVRSADGKSIEGAVVDNLRHWKRFNIKAKQYVVACGTVLSAQLLYNSNIRPYALGRYLAEQPLSFCQIILSKKLVNQAVVDPRFKDIIAKYQSENAEDAVPFPFHDPDPQCWIPVSENRPWHCQVHRDAFSYGDIRPNIDSRLVVDLRWFGITKQVPSNRVYFSDNVRDLMDMPQPTFEFSYEDSEAIAGAEMVKDMLRCARALGGFIPGSEPQFMKAGTALHIQGVTRMGKDRETSVVDPNCKVWDIDNLFVGGNGVQDVAAAANPTLTSVALAVHSSQSILHNLK